MISNIDYKLLANPITILNFKKRGLTNLTSRYASAGEVASVSNKCGEHCESRRGSEKEIEIEIEIKRERKVKTFARRLTRKKNKKNI